MPYEQDEDVKRFYRTHPDRHPMDEKPEFDFGEFLRQKRVQDALNAHDPEYNPDSAVHWIETAKKLNEGNSGQGYGTDAAQEQYKVPEFKPPTNGPGETRYKELLSQQPKMEDWHPSKLRSGLSTAAGIASGIVFGPRAGEQVQETIRDAPYRRKYASYNQNLQNAKEMATDEGNQAKLTGDLEHRHYQSVAESERAGAEHSRRLGEEYKIGPVAFERAQTLEKIKHPGANAKGELYKVVDVTGKTHLASIDPTSGTVKTSDGTVIPEDQIDFEKTGKFGAAPLRITNPLELFLRDNPNATLQDYLKLHPESQSEYAKYEADYKKTKPDATQREILRAFSADKEQPQRPPQALAIGPDGRAIAVRPGTQLPQGSRTMAGESQMNTPTAATRGRGEAAQTAIAAGKDVQDFANANRAKLGNVGTYWNNLLQNTPAADPTVEKFRGKVQSWAAFQAAAHGFRASTVLREFEARVGTAKDVDSIIAAVQGINDELEHAVETGRGVQTEKTNTLPGGITIDQINAEIARRKAKK